MSQYDKLQKEYEALKVTEYQQFEVADMGMNEMAEDSRKTATMYKDAPFILSEIDKKFCVATKLDSVDITFLMFATALQIGRWVILAEISKALDKKLSPDRLEHNAKSITEMESKKRANFQADIEQRFGETPFKDTVHRDWKKIVFDSVPYDITRGSTLFGVNMQGKLHRIHTLGHDPVLGWLFGIMNILSDTITLDQTYSCKTYNVEMINKPKRWISKTTFVDAFAKALDSIREDKIRLPASVFAQALHLKSDEYTKLGLPVPVLEAFSPDFAGNLYKSGYDSLCLVKDIKNIAIFGSQTVVALLINMLITLIHGLYYDPSKHGSRELYEVKTRKILDYSNLIASSSNVITVAGMSIAAFSTKNETLGKKALSTLDVGGIIVTIHRLITDTKFINQIKKEFLEKEWYNAVVGEDYQFIAEVKEMSKKDIQKGIAIQAKADADKAAKLADGMEVHAKVLSDIRDTQTHVRNSVDVILQDKADQEAELLFGLRANKKVSDLGHTEQRVLGATLYTLMANSQNVSELQKQFYCGVEQYGISERVDSFNFSNLKNIDSFSDRKIILKAICAFLFLHDCNTAFKDDVQFNWLAEFTSTDDVDCVCQEIAKEFSVLGGEGLMLGYIPPSELLTDQLPEIEVIEDGSEDSEIGEGEGEFDYSFLYEIIGRYTDNEQAFGKKFKPKQAFLDREFGKEHPGLSPSGVIAATKVSNGYLLFTTYAIYLKTGSSLRGGYVCLPYEKILSDKISAGVGKVKGTRKLVIPYLSSENEIAVVEVDDKKIEEEKLRELIHEITKSGGTFPKTDRVISFECLRKEILVDYLSILATILHTEGHSLTEVYLMTKDCGLDEEWENIVDFIPVEEVTQWIDAFLNEIPYPSECEISNEGMALCIRTLCRTNILEGNDATVLSQFEEHCAKQFDMMDLMPDAVFSILLEHCSKDIRELDMGELLDVKAGLSDNTSFADAIGSDLEMMIGKLQAKEEAKRNTPAAKLTRVIQDGAIPVAKGIANKLKGK